MQWKDNLSPSSINKLASFADLILHWNSRINLTGYRTREQIEELLIGESVLALQELQKSGLIKTGASILDFGSGAGIPGLVWSMLGLPMFVTSLEIRQKKVAFQKEVVRELGLKANIIAGRFPEAVMADGFDLIVSRAIRFDPRIWEQGRHLLNPGGKFVRFAAPDVKVSGWQILPVSEKTSLQIGDRNVPRET